MKELLELKIKMKKRMPDFIRSDAHKKAKLSNNERWRKPKGLQNKMRLQIKGYRRIVKTGYGTPAKLRGFGRDGKESILIQNVEDLKKLKKGQKAMIASQVGLKNKVKIVDEAKKMNIEIANYKNAEQKIQNLLEQRNKQRKDQDDKKTQRDKKKEAVEKNKEENKKGVEKKIDDEEKKKEEKKEKDSVLTHKA